ncbi:hypothetical protein A2397_03685 [Candidatus Amesbacteria bacterium RIFOXYB1_FULL_44_23]|uniref:Uncharacterized protein n=1 Tax=Candidatus Amesbacteria bacterium RIFOXYB1_FULL_44_23 TaxID=1797263 RepID=A0A1F4ZPM8_9BACT|nr:MAG: hypothetical protein A2397_03685 [Candidatus Amesbacteria bacterium RIFOXYB1_FULL_44_23]
MEIEMFKIGATSLKHRTSIALLVDKPEFVKTIKRLREKWNLTKLFQPDQDSELMEHICGPEKNYDRWDNFCADIETVRRCFNRTPNFDKVIKYALAFTEIPEGAFRSTYFKAIDNSEYPDDIEYAIIVTPHSTPAEVTSELKEFKQIMQDQIEYRSDKGKLERAIEKYRYEPGPAYKDFDSLGTLDRTRLWYWEMYGEQIAGNANAKLKSYEEIDKELRLECPKGQDHETKAEQKKCPYCGLDDINSMQHLLPKYKKALESQ